VDGKFAKESIKLRAKRQKMVPSSSRKKRGRIWGEGLQHTAGLPDGRGLMIAVEKL
jgi:hypothetical protein